MTLKTFAFLILVTAFATPAISAEPPVERQQESYRALLREMTGEKAIELRELEIRAKIYEPQVIYILDRSRLEVFYSEDPVNFTDRIYDAVEDDRL